MEVLGSGASGQSSGKVWIEPHPTEGWAPGTVDSVGAGGAYVVVDEHGEQFEVPQDKARPVDKACLRGVDDLLSLGDFNEGSLLHNVRVRYFRDEIYTGIGGPILISVNPFQSLPSLYSAQKQKFYRDASAQNSDVAVPPHLFSVGAAAHSAMLGDSRNQSIIITGESGAGKTEATKRILAYFAQAQKTSNATADRMSIEEQVLRSNPILEAFGNAKTVRNDNSSRFGKYIDIEFDAAGKLQSARISNYLLEKVRIVKQQPDERGYHAFYMMCAGASRLGLDSMLHLSDARDHAYTCGCTEIDGVDDAEQLQEMIECMVSLGFTTDEKNAVLRIAAAVLHLGDLEFQTRESSQDGTKIVDTEKAQQISQMLQIDLKDFSKVFAFKTFEDPCSKKIIDIPQEEASSSNTRHSMAKTLYSRLFDWLVWRINQSTMAKKSSGKQHRIGILDIYGFEVFEWNSFEQLCINFANEKLQQHFNSHMFTLEQQLYTEEGIAWSHITWQDNRDIIDTLERKPLGLFPIFDSECLMPNATDPTCLNKIYNSFKSSRIVYKPSRFASSNFAVAHFAGEVIYDITSFLEKNTDKLHADIINLMKTSSLPLLKSLFTDAKFAPELAVPAAAKGRPAAAPRSGSAADNSRAKQNVTVSMMFRQQLDQLVEDLNKTNPRYIRCIKPNGNKMAREFDSIDVQRQLRCAGMLESIRIRRAGYSVRRPFKEFFNRFRMLAPSCSAAGRVDADFKELCRKILAEMEALFQRRQEPLEPKSWQIGRSKVFLKEDLQNKLETAIGHTLRSFVVRIQRTWRGSRERRRYKAIRAAGLLLQAGLRTMAAVAAYREQQRQHKATVAVQAALRMAGQRLLFLRRRRAVLRVQSAARGWACRRRVGKLKGKMAAERIQKLREDEARKDALDSARRAAEEKERALEEMQRQLEREREQAKEDRQREEHDRAEARRRDEALIAQRLQEDRSRSPEVQETRHESLQLERLQRQMAEMQKENWRLKAQLETARPPSPPLLAPEQDAQLKQEMLDLRKENARLQGQLECRPADSAAASAAEAQVDQLRRELQEMRREKVRLEVDLATAKSSDEYEALAGEAAKLREELSGMRRARLDAELQLDQKTAQLDEASAQAARAEASATELASLRSAHDDLQVQLHRVQAQRAALEERSQGDETARAELRELRMEKLRLEGELETAQLREAAIAEKMRSSERAAAEVQQLRQRIAAADADLDVSRQHAERLREQVAQLNKEGTASRSDSLDQLRIDLMSRIDAKARPSAPEAEDRAVGSAGDGAGSAPGSAPGSERKTLLNQRAIFEQLKQQFQDTKASEAEDPDSSPSQDVAWSREAAAQRELELEEELKQARRESVELSIKVEGLQAELQDQRGEAHQLLQSSSLVQAELADVKLQLEQECSSSRRQAAVVADLQDRLAQASSDAAAAQRRQAGLDECRARAEEEARAAQGRVRALEDELAGVDGRIRDLQARANEAAALKDSALLQIDEHRTAAERLRSAKELADRGRVESESSLRWLESENERLKAELQDANAERAKIRQVVDELVRADTSSKLEDLQQELERQKARAARFEREYNTAKQLNGEMTKVMAQMTQAHAERTDERSGAASQNRLLQQQLQARAQELRDARRECDEVQQKLDVLQTTGSHYQERYRDAQEELRSLRQEHSVSAATSSKLKMRVESLQKEAEDLKAQRAKLSYEARASADDNSKIDRYESHVRELQQELSRNQEELDKSQAFGAKTQAVNDCLNTMLVVKSEEVSLLESAFTAQEPFLRSQLTQKKQKEETIVNKLKEIMSEEQRPSIAFLDRSLR